MNATWLTDHFVASNLSSAVNQSVQQFEASRQQVELAQTHLDQVNYEQHAGAH